MPPKIDPDSWKTRYEIDPRTQCWNWTAYTNDDGYGIISQGRGRRYRAHRYVYERLVGPIPEGRELDHKCRNHGCINPRHMDPVTHKLNTLRGDMGLHNARKTHCKHGHEFTPENTISRPGKNGKIWRECRECKRREMRERMRRVRATRKT